MFDAVNYGYTYSINYFSNLRGVGKPFNKCRKVLQKKKVFCKHIEIEERNDLFQIGLNVLVHLRNSKCKKKNLNI